MIQKPWPDIFQRIIRYENDQSIEALHQIGFDVSKHRGIRTARGATPLHFAAFLSVPTVLDYLIRMGESPIELDSRKASPLHYAAGIGCLENVKSLLAQPNVEPSAQDKAKKTPLHWACESLNTYNSEIIKCLADEAPESINVQDCDGNTPLHAAIQHVNTDAVHILLAHSPNLELLNLDGKSVIDIAQDMEDYKILSLLMGSKIECLRLSGSGTLLTRKKPSRSLPELFFLGDDNLSREEKIHNLETRQESLDEMLADLELLSEEE